VQRLAKLGEVSRSDGGVCQNTPKSILTKSQGACLNTLKTHLQKNIKEPVRFISKTLPPSRLNSIKTK
ncbi:MAG: hypothetical protein NC252_10330, partial [Roseburia sp.]|nr:hypothetical protein [Roseburia sp.]MCM1420620.1 hypothetical protein [Bacteroides sp.]